jgi:hypothetical protein
MLFGSFVVFLNGKTFEESVEKAEEADCSKGIKDFDVKGGYFSSCFFFYFNILDFRVPGKGLSYFLADNKLFSIDSIYFNLFIFDFLDHTLLVFMNCSNPSKNRDNFFFKSSFTTFPSSSK